MFIIRPLFNKPVWILSLLVVCISSCSKDSATNNSTGTSSYLKFQFKGKSYEITGNQILFQNTNGVYAETSSEQATALLYPGISGVFSVLSLEGTSKEFSISIGALKKGVVTGTYSYSILGKDGSNRNIYAGVLYDAIAIATVGIPVLIGPQYVGSDEIIIDYTDGGKKYAIIPEQSTVTVTESSTSKIAGTFDITCKYGSLVQKLTGSFSYKK